MPSHQDRIQEMTWGESHTECWLTRCMNCPMLDLVIFEEHGNQRGMQRTTRWMPYGLHDSNSGLRIEDDRGYLCVGCGKKRQITQIEQVVNGEVVSVRGG